MAVNNKYNYDAAIKHFFYYAIAIIMTVINY